MLSEGGMGGRCPKRETDGMQRRLQTGGREERGDCIALRTGASDRIGERRAAAGSPTQYTAELMTAIFASRMCVLVLTSCSRTYCEFAEARRITLPNSAANCFCTEAHRAPSRRAKVALTSEVRSVIVAFQWPLDGAEPGPEAEAARTPSSDSGAPRGVSACEGSSPLRGEDCGERLGDEVEPAEEEDEEDDAA